MAKPKPIEAQGERIRWDHEELVELAKAVQAQGIKTVDSPAFLSTVRQVQKDVLPPNRRRELHTNAQVNKVREAFKLMHKAQPNHMHIVKRPPPVTVAVEDGQDVEIVAAKPAPPPAEPITEPQLVRTPPPPMEPKPLVPPPPAPQPQHALPQPLITHAMAQAFSDSADVIMETLAGALAERFVKHLRRALTEVADREVAAFLHGTAPPLAAAQPLPSPVAAPIPAPTQEISGEAAVAVAATGEAEMADHPVYAPAPHGIPHDAPDHLAHLDPPPPSEVVPNAHPFRQEQPQPRPTLAVQPREKKKVAMLGLPPGQLNHIAYDTRKKLDIKVVDQNLSQSELQHKIAHCDVVIGAWGIGKVARGVAKNHPNFILIEGGMTQLKRLLDAMV